MTKNELYKDRDVRVSDKFIAPSRCVNNSFTKDDDKSSVDKKDKDLLYKVLPFTEGKKSVDEWLYKNRIGVVWVSAIYVVIITLIVFVRYDVGRFDSRDSIFIDVPLEKLPTETKPKVKEPELSPEQIRKMAEEPIKNVAIDENNNLNTGLQDAKNINSDKLYEEARKVQAELEANSKRYQKGLEAIESKYANTNKGDNSEKNIGESKSSSVGGNTVAKGNVTVSFNLSGRSAVHLEIPAYRCEGGGRVVVDIVVAKNGDVISASIRSASGGTDSCVQDMALMAAKMSTFSVSRDGSDKQMGTMTFLFVQQ